ncbi:MAG: hypothetical protein R6W68_14695 [Ignavibacteriaceae bacterium]
MGKSSLIMVMGVSVIIAFFILKLNANSTENLSTSINMFEQTQARLIANTGVEIYLEKLYADTLLINTTSPKLDLFNGSYQVKLEGVLPNVRVTATSEFQGIEHVSVADAILEPVDFPPLPGAMYITGNSISNAKLTGDLDISGVNHDINGTRDLTTDAVYGVSCDSEADRIELLTNLLKPDKVEGLIKSTQTVGTPSVEVNNLGLDWSKVYQYLANNADQTFLHDIPNGTDLGTLASPKITLINADAAEKKQISISQSTGAGILIVNGDITFQGNFEYKGIILCYKNATLKFSTQGTNTILGGIIAAGNTVEVNLGGTFYVKYSKDVLDLVKFNLKSNGFRIVRWYE